MNGPNTQDPQAATKTVADSQVEVTQLMRPQQGNFAGNSVGTSSMQVGISVIAEDPRSPDSERRTTRSFFTMVALDDDGNALSVPRLQCETAEDHKWQCEAELRRSLRKEFNERLATGICR